MFTNAVMNGDIFHLDLASKSFNKKLFVSLLQGP